MRRFLIIAALLLFHYGATAQVMEGLVIDNDNKTTIADVNIFNTRTGVSETSDKEGHYSIPAISGDTLLFRHVAYQTVTEVMTFVLGTKHKTILMQPSVYKLQETKITAYTRYQQDSIEKHTMYGHELNKTLVPTPKYYGVACAGCIGWLADKITGNSKKPKQFRKQFADDDKNLFIDSRYTFPLVTVLTGISDTDSIAAFIYTYPMAYDFARQASDLEIKMWIRENYKQYLQMAFVKEKDMAK